MPVVLAPPISVVVVARNEAHNLPRCLDSVRGWVAEIVVVLNNTTDQSAAIARQHGAVVFETEWRGYRDTKNWAIGQARQPWALCLDADEEVSSQLRADIEAFFQRGDHKKYAGAQFPRKVWFLDRWITHGDWYPDRCLRLIDRSRARWGGDQFVHEKMVADGPVATLRGDLHHYSFPTLSSHVAKINPFADLFVQQQQEKGGRFSLLKAIFRPFWRFPRAYIFKLGFLDGFPGFYIAVATAFGTFVRYSRLYEQENREQPPKG
ncbi:MAG TPA: glycosyltransferase family 2 protein [Candidatus Didemnitutus sp.]|nr:glycosyltransferase family 2 protein [Candidatus Didemnitutus sp.]